MGVRSTRPLDHPEHTPVGPGRTSPSRRAWPPPGSDVVARPNLTNGVATWRPTGRNRDDDVVGGMHVPTPTEHSSPSPTPARWRPSSARSRTSVTSTAVASIDRQTLRPLIRRAEIGSVLPRAGATRDRPRRKIVIAGSAPAGCRPASTWIRLMAAIQPRSVDSAASSRSTSVRRVEHAVSGERVARERARPHQSSKSVPSVGRTSTACCGHRLRVHLGGTRDEASSSSSGAEVGAEPVRKRGSRASRIRSAVPCPCPSGFGRALTTSTSWVTATGGRTPSEHISARDLECASVQGRGVPGHKASPHGLSPST